MIPDESYIDYRYRKMLFKVFEQQPTIKRWNPNLTYRMECPLCGARNSNLVWMPHRRTWKFLCSTKSRANCQSQMEFPVLLRAWNPELFLSYQQERFEAGTTGFGFNCPRPQPTTHRRAPVDFPSSRTRSAEIEPTGISTAP